MALYKEELRFRYTKCVYDTAYHSDNLPAKQKYFIKMTSSFRTLKLFLQQIVIV